MGITKLEKQIKEKSEWVLGILYPKTCPVCETILEKNTDICPQCNRSLVYIREPKCKKCGKALDKLEENSKYREYCEDCNHRPHIYESGMAVFQYGKEIKASITRFKYHNQRTYAGFYGTAMAKEYKDWIKRMGIQCIVPVPVSKEKQISRGFNQAELLADALGEKLGLPVRKDWIVRVKHTIPQKELNYQERKNNLKNAFKIVRNDLQYKVVLVVDDIYTTGSTIDACAGVLKASGVQRVHFISLSIGAGI